MLFKKKDKSMIQAAKLLYVKIIYQSRDKRFYTKLSVPDTLDGRFELIVLHFFFVYNLLKEKNKETLSEEITKIMFKDFDMSLREMGVGDLSVGKKIYFMNESLAGRIKAYKVALKEGKKSIYNALKRNIYGTLPDIKNDQLIIMTDYFVDSLNLIKINNFIEFTEKDDIFLNLNKYT